MRTNTQLSLPLKDPRYRRPMMDMAAAKGVLDCCERDVLAAIDSYALIAWDIRTPDVSRRELRILSASVAEYAQLEDPSPCYHCTIVPDVAVEMLLPGGIKTWISGVEVQRILNCTSGHFLNLVAAKCLAVLPGSSWQRGPGGSRSITKQSFSAFLNSRFA